MKEILYIYKQNESLKLQYIDEDGKPRQSFISDFPFINRLKPGIALDIKNIIIKETWYKYKQPYILSTLSTVLNRKKLWM